MADQQLRPWYIEETEQPPQSEPLNLPFGYYLEGSTDPYGSNIGGSLNFDIPLNNGSLSGGVRGNVHNYDNQMGGTLSGSNLQYNTDDYSLGGQYFDYGPFENPETILSPYGLPSTGQGFMGRGTIRYADGGDVPTNDMTWGDVAEQYKRGIGPDAEKQATNYLIQQYLAYKKPLGTLGNAAKGFYDLGKGAYDIAVGAGSKALSQFPSVYNPTGDVKYHREQPLEQAVENVKNFDFKKYISENPVEATMTLGSLGFGAGALGRKVLRSPFTREILINEEGSVPLGKGKKDLPSVNQIQQKASSPSPTKTQAELEQDLLSWWGQKHKDEKKISKILQKEYIPDESKVLERGSRQKVNFDVFRTLQNDQGENAVLESVRNGEHLRPDGKGGYIGAPKWIRSPRDLQKLRDHLDKQFERGVDALTLADPNRVGSWWDRAKSAQAASNEPYQLKRNLEGHAVHSAGVSPENELFFQLRHGTSRALGAPEKGFRGPPSARLDAAVANNSDLNLGPKIGPYADRNNPNIPNEGLFGVNDFRWAQAFGYTTPQGKPFQGTVSQTMHPFMDAETALAVDRARRKGVGGKTDWHGGQIQEIPWVINKAQDLHKRSSTGKGRFSGDKMEGIKGSLREGNNTIGDYLPKHIISETSEDIPGKSTNHIPEILAAPFEERENYTIPWAYKKEAGDTFARDPIYSALGFRQLAPIESSGFWNNLEGGVETNPLTIYRPLKYAPSGQQKMGSNLKEAVSLGARLRGVIDAQEAVAANSSSRQGSGLNALTIDTRSMMGHNGGPQLELHGGPTVGLQPTGQQLGDLNSMLSPYKYGATATSEGVHVFPFDPSTPAREVNKVAKVIEPYVSKEFPSATVNKVLPDNIYEPALATWGENGMVPTKPFSGEATMNLLSDFAKADPTIARNLSEDEAVRKIIGQKHERDTKYKSAREDIQNTRKFFKEADWNKVVELIREGMAPAAALAAMGYSFSALADEPTRSQ